MILSKTIGSLRLTFTFARVTKVIGVNSNLADGNHIIMWDFDNMSPYTITGRLKEVQVYFDLPEIRVVKTSEPNNYVAYCFKRCSWEKSRLIVIMTEGVDQNFIKYGVYRGHWTLRVTAKRDIPPKYAFTVSSNVPPDVKPEELLSWVRYQTLFE